jgi:hypothetical protein
MNTTHKKANKASERQQVNQQKKFDHKGVAYPKPVKGLCARHQRRKCRITSLQAEGVAMGAATAMERRRASSNYDGKAVRPSCQNH